MWTNLVTTINSSFTGQTEHVPVSFENSDLDANNELILRHGRNTLYVIPEALFSASGQLQDQAGIFTILDANTCKYTFSGELEAGKYLFIFKFLYL